MTKFWDDYPSIKAELEKVSALIAEAVQSNNPIVSEASAAIFSGDGKLLRPGLLLAASRFGPKYSADKTRKLAAALEILHVATLVHDDVIDDSPLRRGVPTARARYGKKDAVLIGDFLMSRCFLLAGRYTSPRNATILAWAIAALCSMELEQNSDRFHADSSVRRYLRKITGKTALLFALAGHIGAAEAKAPSAIVSRLRRAGYDIGMAFQIVDDVLDYEGDACEIGKPVGGDVAAGLVTLPLIFALEADTDGALAAAIAPGAFERGDPKRIVALVKERGGTESAGRHALIYTERARRELSALPKSEHRDLLFALTERLLVRRY